MVRYNLLVLVVETKPRPSRLLPRFLKNSDLAPCPRWQPDSSENIVLVIWLLLSAASLSLAWASLFWASLAFKMGFFVDLFTVQPSDFKTLWRVLEEISRLFSFNNLDLTYLTGSWTTRVRGPLLPRPHQNHHIMAQNSPLWTCIGQGNTRYLLESTYATCLHVRALCPVPLHRPHRRWDGSPTSARFCFFDFFLSLRTPKSWRAVKRALSSTVKVLSAWICFLLCDFRRVAAALAALSSLIYFYANTSLCAIIAALFKTFLKASTIDISKLSRCL